VPLNDEQKRVLEMVVDEGKNVFFTGAAGTRFIHIHATFYVSSRILSLILCFCVDQGPEIATAPSYHCCPQEETCKETGLSFLSQPAQVWLLQTLAVRFSLYFGLVLLLDLLRHQ
jgi:hypothetical protein